MGVSAGATSDNKPQWAHAVAGGFAGACSRLVVGPLDVVKIRMQVQLEPIACGMNSKYTGIRQALVSIFREEGLHVRIVLRCLRTAAEGVHDYIRLPSVTPQHIL